MSCTLAIQRLLALALTCQVEVQVWREVAVGRPQRLPQAQHLIKRELALEVNEQPPADTQQHMPGQGAVL